MFVQDATHGFGSLDRQRPIPPPPAPRREWVGNHRKELHEVHAGSVFGHLSSGLEYGPSPFGPTNHAVSFLQSS
jgi:hypothetical protein